MTEQCERLIASTKRCRELEGKNEKLQEKNKLINVRIQDMDCLLNGIYSEEVIQLRAARDDLKRLRKENAPLDKLKCEHAAIIGWKNAAIRNLKSQMEDITGRLESSKRIRGSLQVTVNNLSERDKEKDEIITALKSIVDEKGDRLRDLQKALSERRVACSEYISRLDSFRKKFNALKEEGIFYAEELQRASTERKNFLDVNVNLYEKLTEKNLEIEEKDRKLARAKCMVTGLVELSKGWN